MSGFVSAIPSSEKSAAATGTIRLRGSKPSSGGMKGQLKMYACSAAALGKRWKFRVPMRERWGFTRAAENVRQPEGDARHPHGQPLCRTGATFRGYRRAARYPYVAAMR